MNQIIKIKFVKNSNRLVDVEYPTGTRRYGRLKNAVADIVSTGASPAVVVSAGLPNSVVGEIFMSGIVPVYEI